MKKSRKAIALLLALVMLITMLPVAAFATEAPAPATNVVEAVTEVEVVEGGQQVAIEMPNFDEADELARIKAREDRSLFRALPIIPPWDPSQLKADIVFDLTTNSGAHDFLWDQIFEAEGGAFDLVVSYIENGEPKTQTVQITAPGETVLLPQMPIYNADGSKIDYQFKVTFPDDVAYKVTVDTWQTSGAYDSLTNPKKYILKSSFTRLISTEIAAIWYTNNDANPELTGTYDTGAGATIPTFKIPTTNLSTILRASFARDIDPETGQVVFKDINGDGIIDQPMVPEDNVLGVGDGTGDGGVWVEVDNVVNGKVTADGKDYFVVVDFNEVTGGVITIREALTVTFNKGDATTMTPAGTDDKVVVEVGHSEVVQGIPVAEKDGATFVGWKDDSGTIVDLTKPVTTSLNLSPVFNDDVIPDPEDPDNPVIPPAGYVTVEFTTDTTKGTLQGTKKFYVNPEADPIVTYAQIIEPTILPETGYKVADIKWDPNFAATDTITAAATHAAQYVKLDDVIPDPEDPENPITPPEGYVTVEFTTDANGTLEGTKKFYVNPKADPVVTYEQITAPTIKPATGYKVADKPWDPEFAATDEIKAAATHAAQYVKLDDVIPDPEDPENPITPPEGYVTVEFTTDANGTLEGTKKFYVNPKADPVVTYEQITAPTIKPATGYKVADKPWDPEFAATDEIKAAATHAAQYVKLDDVIPDPEDPENPITPPEGYVTVEFTTDANGTLEGTKKFYVNPKADPVVTYEQITAPTIKPATGYKVADKPWDPEFAATDEIKAAATHAAQYVKLDDVIPDPEDPENPITPPEGYVTVEFTTDANGTLEGTKKFYVNPKADPVVTYEQITAPTIKPATGYKVADKPWDPEFAATDEIKAAATHAAQYVKLDDVIPDPEDPENPITPPEGYVTVEFTTDANGTLEGTKKFYVNPKADPVVTYEQITAPTIKPATGYKVADKPWDPEFAATDEIKAAATHAAQYVKLDDVIPDPEDPENPITPPEGYVTVEFTTDANGTLEGTKKFYVNPKADPVVTYEQITAPTIKPATGYKVADKPWDPEFAATDEIKAAATHAAQYVKLDDVIPDPEDPENPITPPEGYVTVEFTTDANGTLEGTKKFYVNPKADPVVTYEQITAPTIKPATGYKVADKPWDPEFAATDEIKAAATHAAQYVKLDDVIPDPEDPENPITPPEGYVTVEFTTEATKGALEGTKKFYVNPKADPVVTYEQITAPTIKPATGYKVADKPWDPEFAATDEIKAAATHAAQYTKLDDIIPDTTPDTDDDKPEGYVTVTFAPGANGSITTTDPAQVVKYYVNPLANKTLGDITKPEITANPGFTHTGWDTEDTVAITADTPVTATYIAMTAGDKPVIQGPILNTAETVDVVAKPGSTVTVIFPNAVDGEPPIEVTTTTHDEFGKYTVDVPTGAKMEPGQQINATSTEPGNTPVAADPVPVTQLDSRVPSKPVQDKQELTGTIPNVTPETVQTGWELILTDLEGNPLVDGEGNPITGTIDGNGNYTFPITDLTDGQEVKVQLTEPNNKPGLSEPGVVDKNPPSITDITSAQEPGMIVITAKTDDSTGTFVIDVDGTKYGATVDENGNITASVPSDTPITAIKIMAEDEFENSNEENVPLPTAGQIITQLRQAYAGNRRVIVDSSSKYPVFYLKLIRDGVETDLGTQTGDELGRATFTLTQRLQAGDIIEAYCEADGMRSDTVRMDIP